MSMRSDLPTQRSLDGYLISSRSFPEYRAMFDLTDADLRGRLLDCPGGGASFTAAACAMGVEALAVDPVYALPAQQVATCVSDDLGRGGAWLAENHDAYAWDFHGSREDHEAMRADSARRFTEDLHSHPHRYVAGALPSLPFRTGSFDLVLCSHLLFTYADRLDVRFHWAALREMLRVSCRQVRVYPLLDQAGRPLPNLLEALLGLLAGAGVRATIRQVDYEFQHGATHMLQLESS